VGLLPTPQKGPTVTIRAPSPARRLRGLAALAVLALALWLTAGGTLAATSWCRSDPHISVGGRTAHVTLGYDVSKPNTSTGPIQLIVTVPKGKATAILAQDLGFGRGWQVTFQESSQLPVTPGPTSVQLSVYVPATTNMALQLVSTPDCSPCPTSTKTGTANAWFTLLTQV
jgi:hypothetical protein